MKTLKYVSFLSLMLIVMTSFSQCASSKKLQEKSPGMIGEVYFENWVAGVQGGGAGTNIVIPVSGPQIALDSVYFRGEVAKLEQGGILPKPAKGHYYIGRFYSKFNQDDGTTLYPPKEDTSQNSEEAKPIPFKLEENECVISYFENDVIKYYKISLLCVW